MRPLDAHGADQPVWRDQVLRAAHAAVEDLRADDALHHAVMIEDLEALIARLSDDPPHAARPAI